MKQSQTIRRVFILGMDGAGNFVREAATPDLDAWLGRGAYTYFAQAELPTISAECWGSVLHGVKPERHGLNNEKAAESAYPSDSPYPSLFRLVREREPDAKLASFTGWSPINSGIIEETLDVHKVSLPDAELVPALLDYIDGNPDVRLLFLQLDEPDGSGHGHGYGADSPEYLAAIAKSSERIGRVLARIEARGLAEDSLIVLLTDHGGGGADKYNHGSDHPMDRDVFWGVIGPGVKRGALAGPVSITDTAAVAALALGLPVPEDWDAGLPDGLLDDGAWGGAGGGVAGDGVRAVA
ncbi:alkaline phosphatase family protein [Cohnella nanjingensis]|uniref:Alkaline phosphatase family protein n=2 Tax=Cohnella nanjingensis TaxID=1387779 RepID=A0A7X0VFL2_9BACL|nr:alkaline phosphatase family protein [Cohnella nanjingensis]